jgi:hypothetical protein
VQYLRLLQGLLLLLRALTELIKLPLRGVQAGDDMADRICRHLWDWQFGRRLLLLPIIELSLQGIFVRFSSNCIRRRSPFRSCSACLRRSRSSCRASSGDSAAAPGSAAGVA